MMARRAPGGMVTVSARPYIVIPAVPGQDMRTSYSFAVVAQALSGHVLFPRDEGGRS